MKKLLACLTLICSVSSFAQSTWYEISTGTDHQLNAISFASSSVGYIGGNDSTLLKSIDGGKTWNSVNFSGVSFFPSGEHIVNLKFTSDDIGYMTVGPYGASYKTTDGGLTWSVLTFEGTMCFNQGIYFWDDNNGQIGGSGCFQGEHIESYSSGTLTASTVNTPSWDAQDLVLDIDFLNSSFGLAVSESRFLRTTDGGATWDTIPSGVDQLLTSIEIINDTLAYAGYIEVSTGFGALVTHDAGLTWNYEMSMATFAYPDYLDVAEAANGYLYAGGTGWGPGSWGMMFEDKGAGWLYTDVDQAIRSIDSYADSTVFAVGDSGYVITNVDPAMLNINDDAYLQSDLKIYPNPVNETINFEVQDFGKDPFEVVIWNLSGQEVYRSKQAQPFIKVNDLSSGTYILEFLSDHQHYRQKFIKE